jgi:hypothetical protein
MREQVEFFFASLDLHLAQGHLAEVALLRATEDYARVYAVRDGRTELQRAARVALDRISEEKEA